MINNNCDFECLSEKSRGSVDLRDYTTYPVFRRYLFNYAYSNIDMCLLLVQARPYLTRSNKISAIGRG